MKIYLAPMEGITGYTYRNVYRHFYEDADRYFTPFISPHKKFGTKVLNEISRDNNQGMDLIPQLMVGNYEEAIGLCDLLSNYGYREVNINTGCPSGTVVNKKRGSGLLRDYLALDSLFEELFAYIHTPISLKTRIGWSDEAEWPKLAEVIGRYPFSEVIIHGRTREEFYSGKSHQDCLNIAKEYISSPIIYNGDIYSIEDAEILCDKYPYIDGIMVGRGVLANPALIEQLKASFAGKDIPVNDNERAFSFVSELYDRYLELFGSEINTLYHMKEIWGFMGPTYPDKEKELKTIRKTKSTIEYKQAVRNILK